MKQIVLSEENDQWLRDWKEQNGRSPRILHIGNIANNAYLNAKILNKAGFDCDVLCYNYYHIMGCPEWEDADFLGSWGDDFRPNWTKVDLRGFKRPSWFAQGPFSLCVRYLCAVRQGNSLRARFFIKLLKLCWGKSLLNQQDIRILKLLRFLKLELMLLILFACLITIRVNIHTITLHLSVFNFFLAGYGSALLLLFLRRLSVLKRVKKLFKFKLNREDNLDLHLPDLVSEFSRLFLDRKEKLHAQELLQFSLNVKKLRPLFEQYDLIIGYSTDALYPLIAGKRPYFAFEHGTIRNIPFQDTTQGKLCALTYRLADASLITNCDNIIAAKNLGLDNYFFLPHPVNEDIIVDNEPNTLRVQLCQELNADFLVFHPPRQHWEKERHPDWEKGNDIFFKGFARFVKEVNPRSSVIVVDWGSKVQESKELIASLGVASRVKWVLPQPNVQMIRYIKACDLLADQFFLGAFGSTMPKALLHNRPAMLYLDEERHEWCFPEMPPVINASTPLEVFEGLKKLYEDQNYKNHLISTGREWYEKYHSNRVITDTLSKVIQDLLPC